MHISFLLVLYYICCMSQTIDNKKLKYLEFIHREKQDRHHTHTEDMYQYDLLRLGNPKAIEEGVKMFSSNLPGHISNNELRNYKYLFVASITLASRSAILGGMEAEKAYNISDLFILKMDTLQTIEQVKELHKEMFTFYTNEMAKIDKTNIYSKPIVECIDYIYNHLHEPIHTQTLASLVHLNRTYLSTLFKKETGHTISEYVLSKRLEAAKNMLRFSTYTYSEIANILAFSSQSHFTSVFHKKTGYTPAEYRNTFFV